MKKFFLACQLLFFSIPVFSQNWTIINSNDKYNYRLDGNQLITATIWADSIQLVGSDSVYFLNRIMCDSCATVVGGPDPCDTCYGLKNQAQLLQRKMIVTADGVVNFRDPGNIVIKTLAGLNDVWLFDSTQNISATVIAKGTELVFGNSDSIKTLLLSTGDTVKFSKGYGVLQYPSAYSSNAHYRLVGIEGRSLGEQVPKFADFFNFDVGDMFEYHGFSDRLGVNCSGFGPDDACEYVRKYSIQNKSIVGDTIFYQIEGYSWQDCVDLNSMPPYVHEFCYPIINGRIFYVDSANHFCNKYDHELIGVNNIIGIFFFNWPPSYNWNPFNNYWEFNGSPTEYGKVAILNDSNDVLTKKFGKSSLYPYTFSGYHQLDSTSDIMVSLNIPTFPRSFSGIGGNFKIGLGQTDFYYVFASEVWGEEHLVAYRKGNDTIGTFTTDSSFTVSIIENDFTNSFLIYPNPADQWLNISMLTMDEAEISIFDLQSKLLKKVNVSGSEANVDVSQIENGMYFISLKTKDKLFSKKMLILH